MTCYFHLLEITMRDHVRGKRHLRLVPQYEMQKKNAQHSVFVRGFDKATTKSELQAYFSKFGNIDSLYLESEKVQVFSVKTQNVLPKVKTRHTLLL